MAKRSAATDGGAFMRELDAALAKDPVRRRRIDALMAEIDAEHDRRALPACDEPTD